MRALDILVVDDEHDLAFGIADMLEAEGHRAALVGSGEAALELARDRVFDMVFLDIRLPGMNGVDTLRELRKTQAHAQIILMTGYRIDSLLTEVVRNRGAAVLSSLVTVPGVIERLRRIGGGGIVLVAGGDEELGASIEQSLSEQGRTARLARTETEAFESAAIAGLEALVLDLCRPVSSALEIYLALQELGRDVTTIIVARPTGNGKSIVNPLRSISVTGCLFKPFDPAELLQAVRENAADSVGLPSGVAD